MAEEGRFDREPAGRGFGGSRDEYRSPDYGRGEYRGRDYGREGFGRDFRGEGYREERDFGREGWGGGYRGDYGREGQGRGGYGRRDEGRGGLGYGREGAGYGQFKGDVAEAVVERFAPIQERYESLRADEGELRRLLSVGAEKAREASEPTLRRVYEAMGFVAP